MSGEKNLHTLLSTMMAVLDETRYVFVSLKETPPPDWWTPLMVFNEMQGTTCIVPQEQAEAAQIPYEYPCRRITLQIHSSLEAVGFMARIATQLAEEGISVNPVSAFYHDHLFVPEGAESAALQVLEKLARNV